MIGTVVGSYRVVQRLGQGGVGSVYRVRHTVLGTDHALKVLIQPNEQGRQRLIDEGRIQATLRHPNVVAVRDVLDVGGHPGLLMDLVNGPTLARLLAHGPLSITAMGAIGRGILDGMSEAHRMGLVHRDLKPANVLLAIEGGAVVPKVADFGLARLDGGTAGMTSSGASLGTPRFMAPEQVRDPRDVTAASDVWALGVMLYELCAGTPAFSATDLLDLYNDIGAARFVALGHQRSDLPARWTDSVSAAMQLDRSRRPSDASVLAEMWGVSERWPAKDDVKMLFAQLAPALEDDVPAEVTWSGVSIDTAGLAVAPSKDVLVSLPREKVETRPPSAGLAWGIGVLGVGFVALSVALVWTRPSPPVPVPAAAPVPVVMQPQPVAAPVAAPEASPRNRLVGLAMEALADANFEEALQNGEYAAPGAETDDPQLVVAVSNLVLGHRTMALEELVRGRGRPMVIELTDALSDPTQGDAALLKTGHPAALLHRLLAGPMDPTADEALLKGLSATLGDRALVSWARAIEARRRGDLQSAETHLGRAVLLGGGNVSIDIERASFLRAAGRLQEAAVVIDAVVAADRPPASAWVVRALIDDELKRSVQAVDSLKAVSRGAISKRTDFDVGLADARLRANDVQGAFEAIAKAEALLVEYDSNAEINLYRMELHTDAVRLAALLGHRDGLQFSQNALRMMAKAPMLSWMDGEIDVRIDVANALWLHVQGDSSDARRLLATMPTQGPARPARAALSDVLGGAEARVRATLLP